MNQINNFKLISSLKANDRVEVKKYTSIVSGLNVVIANVPGPLVSGFFTLATEAFDDDGLPHTLEHLIFLGSEDYPYKGVLDLLANRNLASGTNAWTDTDHTCYTMTTAGTEGFLNLMPVFVDHILYPTLNDSGYITEVYHVTGEGEDAGVVYCEIQGRENSGESRVHLEMIRAAYPGHCGYKSEISGIMKNLRESTNNVKVRQYHKEFYRPENLTLIITGEVEPKEILDALSGIEAKIASKGSRPTFVRPWQTSVPPLPKSVDIVVPYPSDEEDNGMVYVAWRGPSAVTEIHKMAACAILLRYLSDSSISPLQKEFIEVADPLASSVGFSLQENSESLLYLTFDNVPVAKLGEIKPRLDAKLREISSGNEPLDMTRLRAVIHRQKLETLLNLETQPHHSVAFMLIGDMLYGNSDESLDERLNPIRGLDKMSEEDDKFWLGLLDEYIIKGLSVTVRGKPSVEERTKLAQDEEMRISERVESLGPEGLKKYSDALAVAKTENEKNPPVSLLTSTPVPDPTKVNLHKIEPYSSDQPPAASTLDMSVFPLYTNIDDIETNFVYLMVLMNTAAVPPNLRLYLPIFLESILESPILRDGKLISHEIIVAELEQDTIATATGIGIGECGHFSCGAFSQVANLTIQVEPSKYERGIRWLKEILYCTQFTAERLSIIAAKLVNEVAEFRRKGNKITHDLIRNINYEKENNNHYVNNMVRQHQFLSNVGKQLSEGIETAINDIEKLRAILTDPQNMAIRMSTNLKTLSSKVTNVKNINPWHQLLPPGLSPKIQKLNFPKDWELLQKNASPIANVLGLGCVESSFFSQSVKSIQDFTSPDLAPLLVFLQYLTQIEGPMWKQIRGLGLAYGYNITPRPDESLLYLTLYKSTNLIGAYKEVKNIVDNHLKDDVEFDTVLLDSAKSSMMYEVIERENTIANAVMQSVLAYFKGVDKNYNRELVEKIARVTKADLLRVGKNYLTPLFDPKKANMSLVCPVSKVEEISTGFTNLGFNIVVQKSLNESFLNC